MEAEQPNGGNPCLISRKKCKLIKETQEKRKCWNKEKHTEKIKEAGSRRESLFHDYGKRIRWRGIKSGTTYYTSVVLVPINEIQDNSQDHVIQLLLFVKC